MPEVESIETPEVESDLELIEEVELEDVPDESADESEEDESTEDESEEDESTEDSADETTHPFERPTVAQIKTAYPDIFKKFPGLQDMYFREREYTKLFPTVDEAKEAAENNQAFVNIQQDIMKGTGQEFFTALKEADTKALERFSGTLLGTLARVDNTAFFKAVNPFVEDIARRIFEKGVKESNDNLKNTAIYLAEYFFGSEDFATGKATTVTKPAENTELETERARFEGERYNASLQTAQTQCLTSLSKLIDNDKFDPEGALSPFIKKTIVNQIISEIGTQLTADKAHLRYMDTLWAQAKRDGYRDLSRITSAYLARAKGLVTSLRSKYVSEALGKRSSIAKGNKQKLQSIQSRKDSGASGSPSTGSRQSGKIDYSKTSDDDILNDRITYK